jgi:hypothetical protein
VYGLARHRSLLPGGGYCWYIAQAFVAWLNGLHLTCAQRLSHRGIMQGVSSRARVQHPSLITVLRASFVWFLRSVWYQICLVHLPPCATPLTSVVVASSPRFRRSSRSHARRDGAIAAGELWTPDQSSGLVLKQAQGRQLSHCSQLHQARPLRSAIQRWATCLSHFSSAD